MAVIMMNSCVALFYILVKLQINLIRSGVVFRNEIHSQPNNLTHQYDNGSDVTAALNNSANSFWETTIAVSKNNSNLTIENQTMEDLDTDVTQNTRGNVNSFGGFQIPNSLISETTSNQLKVVVGYMWIPLCVIGIICNIFNIIVFTDKEMRSATSTYLTAISVFQIAYMVSSLPSQIGRIALGEIPHRQSQYMATILYLDIYINEVFLRTGYWLVMLVSMERMLAIVFPLKRQSFRLTKSPVIIVISLFTTVLLYHTYAAMKYYMAKTVNHQGEVIYGIKKTDYDFVILTKFGSAAKVLFVHMPLVGILICNVILCIALRRHNIARRNLQEKVEETSKAAKERQTTVAILVSTFIFFLLTVPSSTNALIADLLPNYSFFSVNRYTFDFFQNMCAFISLISFSIDFNTYVIMSSNFRRIFVRRCFPCCINANCMNVSKAVKPTTTKTTSTTGMTDQSSIK